MAVKPIPDGYRTVTPYLIVKGAAEALAFYAKAFGAELFRMPGPGGCVMHCEFKIGDSILMMADEFPDMNCIGPKVRGGTTVSILLYVEDCDAVYAQAITAGAKVQRPIKDQFYGDRSGTVEDPFGHVWTIATHKEDLTPEEMDRRMKAEKPC